MKVHECIILPSPPALGCSSTNCIATLTDAQGEFTSPCYPDKYPNLQTCKWTLQAPAGFIIQLSFLDFDLEEAPGCIYDWVVVNTGNADVKFCGPTANGLTLNSTGNVMELSFVSDFSVQKRGFSVSFRHGRFRRTARVGHRLDLNDSDSGSHQFYCDSKGGLQFSRAFFM